MSSLSMSGPSTAAGPSSAGADLDESTMTSSPMGLVTGFLQSSFPIQHVPKPG